MWTDRKLFLLMCFTLSYYANKWKNKKIFEACYISHNSPYDLSSPYQSAGMKTNARKEYSNICLHPIEQIQNHTARGLLYGNISSEKKTKTDTQILYVILQIAKASVKNKNFI